MNTIQETRLWPLSSASEPSLRRPAVAHPAQAQGPMPPAPPVVRPQPRVSATPNCAARSAALERTETDLRRSARDFGGHREKAADLCHQAQAGNPAGAAVRQAVGKSSASEVKKPRQP